MKSILWISFISGLVYILTIVPLALIRPKFFVNLVLNKPKLVIWLTNIWWYGSLSVFVITLIIYHLINL